MELTVKGRILTPKGLREGSIRISRGKIEEVGEEVEPGGEVLDFRGEGKVILPGLIDMHVHLRDFELSHKEDFRTGTKAAARGGYTVVVDMPNTLPRVNRISVLRRREELGRRRAVVDFGLYFGVPEEKSELRKEVGRRCLGIKVYLPEDGERETLEETLRFASREKLLVIAHAEDPAFFRGRERPPEAEVMGIRRMAELSLRHRFRLHLTHLSSSAGLRELERWRKRVRLSADTCPHYLLLTHRRNPLFRVFPPLRTGRDRVALLEGLGSGRIEVVTSDHAPHLRDEKERPDGPGGFPGLETELPLLLTLVKRGKLGLERVVRAYSEAPASLLGLPGGRIERGYVGNLTVVDLKKSFRIDPSKFESKAKYSPFEGKEVVGAPLCTIVRGRPVFLDGEVVEGLGGMNVRSYGKAG
ncbi:MAG: dihydroorotase family protein [Candidatus Hadarchaeales archaeon]